MPGKQVERGVGIAKAIINKYHAESLLRPFKCINVAPYFELSDTLPSIAACYLQESVAVTFVYRRIS